MDRGTEEHPGGGSVAAEERIGDPWIDKHPRASEQDDAGQRDARVGRPRAKHRRGRSHGRAAANRRAEREKLRKGARQAEQTAEQGCGHERSQQATDRNGDRDRAHRGHAGQRESKADERDAKSKHALRDDLDAGFEPGAHTEGVAPGNTEQNRKHDRTDRHPGPLTELGDRDGA